MNKEEMEQLYNYIIFSTLVKKDRIGNSSSDDEGLGDYYTQIPPHYFR